MLAKIRWLVYAVTLGLLTACSISEAGALPTEATDVLPRIASVQPFLPQPQTTSALAIPSQPPNIVFILADDLDADSLKYMPNLKALVADQGTTFSNSFFNISLCCPSRTTILRGQYATNTHIVGNTPPSGGFQKVYADGLEKSTFAVWLQDAGYRMMLAGKYLNGYPDKSSAMYIPPGWDEWYSAVKGNAYAEFNYTLNENGKQVAYGAKPEDYGTDVYAGKVIDFIQRTSKESTPFFVYLSVYAPHGPATPAPRHANLFPNAKAPRTPNFNERDVSDKPAYIRDRPLLKPKQIAQIDADYRKRLQSLQAVDEAIAKIVDTLKSTGQLDNTFIVFASDNGYHLGNHRMAQGKVAPYEEDIRVPLFVRGPGVPAGQKLDHLVGNIDFAPTFAELGGATIPDFVDGRSLAPLLGSNPLPSDKWRQSYLIQNGMPKTTASLTTIGSDDEPPITVTDAALLEPPDGDNLAPAQQVGEGIPPYFGIRTTDYVYVEYSTGERELYDLKKDPYQLDNLAATAKPELVNQLAAQLAKLRKCSGAECRIADVK